MKNFLSEGFTLIELMIVIAIIAILAAGIIPLLTGYVEPDHKCIAGFKFTNGGNQIIGANGSGVPCDEVSRGPK
jgi:prepilin-type N-terminal cleavage/methylation domain-containing protein